MSGPLPDPKRRRRNAPTIPTTELPVSGRSGPTPELPAGYVFATSATAWWDWAWDLPQACGWSEGDLYVVARRAQLEDLWLVRLDGEPRDLRALEREMRELDDRLGLTPKGLAALRWTIVADHPAEDENAPSEVARLDDRRRRLTSA